jgi:phosphohistidine phosphatase SixA
VTKEVELRRHAPRDPGADRLSEKGRVLAEDVGRELPGSYDAVFTSPAQRAAETAAWFLRGLGRPLPHNHGVVEGLVGSPDDSEALAETVRSLFDLIPDGARALAVGHTPLIETAVGRLTGSPVTDLQECEGVLVVEEDGAFRLEAEYRLPAGQPG